MDPITPERVCGACRAPLTGDERQRYCNNTCRQKAHRVRQEARRARACLVCKTPLPPAIDHRGRRPTYCGPVCQQAARLERIRAEAAGAGDLELARTPASFQELLELQHALGELREQLADIDRRRRRARRTEAAGADAAAYRSLVQVVRSILGRVSLVGGW